MLRHLDLSLLRSFLMLADGHSFTRVATLVGRTPPAITQQIQRLEADLGGALLLRDRKPPGLTPLGRKLVEPARQLLALNDGILIGLRHSPLPRLRLGTTQDLAERLLPDLLLRLQHRHGALDLDMRVDRSASLGALVRDGDLDLAVCLQHDASLPGLLLAEEPMLWIARTGWQMPDGGPVPLCLLDPPCSFRSAALAALEAAGRPARIVLGSASLSGLRAGVEAGLGLTVRSRHLLAPGLTSLPTGGTSRLPPLPAVRITAYRRPGLEQEKLVTECVDLWRDALSG